MTNGRNKVVISTLKLEGIDKRESSRYSQRKEEVEIAKIINSERKFRVR